MTFEWKARRVWEVLAGPEETKRVVFVELYHSVQLFIR